MARLLVIAAALLATVGSAPTSSASARGGLPPDVAHAIAVVRCHVPDPSGWGFVKRTACARLINARQIGAHEWALQLRLPPVYCVRLHIGEYQDSSFGDVPGVGSLDEVRCPSGAYPAVPKPELVLRLRTVDGKSAGTVAIASVGARRTRFIVSADMDQVWIADGTCGKHRFARTNLLHPFYSFRSDTTVPLSLASLLRTPHVVLVDAGGAHGGDPLACAAIAR